MTPKVYKTSNGEIGYVWPSPEAIESGIDVQIPELCEEIAVKITRLPHDNKWAWSAWRFNGSAVIVDITLAKTIAHNLRRAKREKLLEPHDKLATSPVAAIKNKALADKQAILDADAPVQVAIDAATTTEQLKQILVNYQAI